MYHYLQERSIKRKPTLRLFAISRSFTPARVCRPGSCRRQLLSSNESRSELRVAKGDPRFELTAAYQYQLQIGAAHAVTV